MSVLQACGCNAGAASSNAVVSTVGPAGHVDMAVTDQGCVARITRNDGALKNFILFHFSNKMSNDFVKRILLFDIY